MTGFHVKYSKRAEKELKKLDRYTRSMIYAWIGKNLEGCADPRVHGKSLTGDKKGQWRYCIGDYRLLCDIQDKELVILALTVGHRKEVYKKQ